MVKAGDEVFDTNGYGLIFRQTAQDTQGALLEMDAFYPPHGVLPPPHLHPSQDEHFHVQNGEFRVLVGTKFETYKTGASFDIPAGTPHAMHNISGETGHLLWQTRPALRSEGFFDAVWRLDLDANAKGLRRILKLAVIFQTYQQEVRLTNPTQRTLLKLLAPIGRRLLHVDG